MHRETVKARRALLRTALALPLVTLGARVLAQEKFPVRPLTLVMAAAPGSAGDFVARRVAEKMSQQLGQSVVVDNRPGAGMIASATAVKQSTADGHTMLLTGNGMALSAGLFNKLPYNAAKDFRPVSMLAFFDLALIVDGQSKLLAVKDLLAYGKANPGKLTIASTRIGSTQHLAAELFKSMTGLDALVVPYKSTADMIGALRNGDVQVAFDVVPPVLAPAAGKLVRVLAVTGSQRFAGLPDVPTVAESGVPGYEAVSWNGVLVPAKTPDAVVRQLHVVIERVVAAPDLRKALQAQGFVMQSSTPEELAQRLQQDTAKWKAVIEKAGIQKQ